MSDRVYIGEQLEDLLGKPLTNEKRFPRSDTAFAAVSEAEAFCLKMGFSVGRHQRDAPIGIKRGRGQWDIQKWRNLDREHKKLLDGVIVGSDKRHGPVTVLWADEEPDAR